MNLRTFCRIKEPSARRRVRRIRPSRIVDGLVTPASNLDNSVEGGVLGIVIFSLAFEGLSSVATISFGIDKGLGPTNLWMVRLLPEDSITRVEKLTSSALGSLFLRPRIGGGARYY